MATFSPREMAEGQAVEHLFVAPARIGEADAVEGDFAARRLRHRQGRGRGGDQRLGLQDFREAAGGAGGGGDFAPDFRQLPERTRAEHGVEHELRQLPGGHDAGQHVARAEPQNPDHAGEGQKDREGGEDRPRLGGGAGGEIGALRRMGKPLAGDFFSAEGLHGPHRAEVFGGEGAGFGERVLRVARAGAHRAAGRHQRQHDDRNGDQHQPRKFGAGIDHQADGPEEHEQTAQGDRGGRAEGRFDLGGVGGQAREQFPGLGRIVEGGVELGHMGENVAAQVGDDALAQRHDQEIARGRGHRQHADDGDQARGNRN